MSDKDKREYPRIPSEATVESNIITYPLTDEGAQKGTSKNIGSNGICVATKTQYKKGDILSLKLDLPGWQRYKSSVATIVDDEKAVEPLTAVVEVVWCRDVPGGGEYEIGVEFRDVYDEDQRALMQYIDHAAE